MRADIHDAGAGHNVLDHAPGVGRLVVGEDRLEKVFLRRAVWSGTEELV
jgi:hypothetical protein